MNKSRIYFFGQNPITQLEDIFPYFTREQSQMFAGYYLIQFYSDFKKMKPLFYFLELQTTWLNRIGSYLSRFFLWWGMYSRVRSYSYANWQNKMLEMASVKKNYGRFFFVLENFHVCPEYLEQDINYDVVIYIDQNHDLAGLYLNKNISLPHKDKNPLEQLSQKYKVLEKENFIVHRTEQDIGLSLLYLEKMHSDCYQKKAAFVHKVLSK